MSEKWDNIPEELKALPQWIAWRMERRDGEMAKIPIDPSTGYPASVSNPATWTTFDKACRAGRSLSGIGFVFTKNDPFCGIDMDNHVDGDLIEWMDSYTERSQSGNGAHIIVRAEIADGRRTPDKKYEIYSYGRYFVMTGDVIRDRPVAEAREKVANFHSFLFPIASSPDKAVKGKIDFQPEWIDHSPRPLSDEHDPVAFLSATVGFKFDALWEGDTSEYQGDDSRADAALLSYLRFATGGDRAQSEALFRQSGLMRRKFERKDYRDRTWAKIDNGDVYTPPEREEEKPAVDLSAIVRVAERESSPWRNVTNEMARDAIRGSVIERMVSVFESVSKPKLPLQISLPKALCLAGCAMSEEDHEATASSGDFSDKYLGSGSSASGSVKGSQRARLRIDTVGGQVANFYCLIVSGSSIGKDMGELMKTCASRHGWHIGNSGSSEGLADALCQPGKRSGLVSISEFSGWLDKSSPQSKSTPFMTDAFSAGWFSQALSKRAAKDIPERSTPYCYPNVIASIQPKAFAKYANSIDLETGFLSRFIVTNYDDENWCGWGVSFDREAKLRELDECVALIRSASGVVSIRDGYQDMIAAPFMACHASHRAHWRRLVSEYAPRIATALAIREPGTPVVDDRLLRRAGIIAMWLYAQAERLFGDVRDTDSENKANSVFQSVYKFIHKYGPCDMTRISRGVKRTSKERRDAVMELLERQYIKKAEGGKFAIVSESVKPEHVSL